MYSLPPKDLAFGPYNVGSQIDIVLNRQIESQHLSPMQIGKYQPVGKQIMPETRFTEFSAFSVGPPEGWDFSVCIDDRCLIITLPAVISTMLRNWFR